MNLHDLAETWGPHQFPTTETAPLTDHQHAWARDGVVIVPGLAPEALMAAYEEEWMSINGGDVALGDVANYRRPRGFPNPTPYVRCPAMRALATCPEIAGVMEELLGEPAGLHLCLTGWKSTERNWHFDQYLNPPHVGGFYVAVWIALADIHPDSGPFQYVPGSHRWWSPIAQDKMRAALGADGDGPDWPKHSERILTPLFEAELEQRGIQPTAHLPKRGDVLFWHGRLLHRGSVPADPTLERRALIAHYSGIHHRRDMPEAVRGDGGRGPWFNLPTPDGQWV